jgi:hypothetical protein
METSRDRLSLRSLGFFSLMLGILGGAFYWWTPLGIVLSLAGLVIGFVGWTFARRRTAGFGLLVSGMLFSLAALILDFVIAGLNLEIIDLRSFY